MISEASIRQSAFVIIYSAEEGNFSKNKHIDSLRKHTDGHTGITILVTLTQPGRDFEGGGTRFWKSDGSTVDVSPDAGGGVFFAAAGQEFREAPHMGLAVTSGRRLVLAYFVDADDY